MSTEDGEKIASGFTDYRAMPGLTFYRCVLCSSVVSPWDVKAGGCQKCGGRKIRPSGLSLWEKLVQLAKHPKVWEWHAIHPEH